MDKSKIIKMVAALAAILVIVGSLSKLAGGDSMSLSEYEALNSSARPPESSAPEDGTHSGAVSPDPDAKVSPKPGTQASPAPETSASPAPVSTLTGASLNGSSLLKERTTYAEGFYYEPVSDSLRRYMTGVSYPAQTAAPAEQTHSAQQSVPAAGGQEKSALAAFEDLRYVHIWHYDFSGTPTEGELICSRYIAQDLVEIFYELYRNEYQLEKVLLVDEYDGDADAAREDGCSFCFYSAQAGTDSALSKHASGLALDINPRYNPRITYEKDGSLTITPASAADHADRTGSFPYKIDEDDLCCKLFVRHGFTWGGNRNSDKDYQHFQKTMP